MKIIIDSNIVFSSILNTESRISDLIMNTAGVFEFYTCEYLREEISGHRVKIMELTGFSEQELSEIQHLLYQHITFVSEVIIPFEFWKKAAEFVRDIDMNDISFVALSLFMNEKLWTGDKKLIEGLTKKGFLNCISTQEMISLRDQ